MPNIPFNIGKSKIRMLRGDETHEHRKGHKRSEPADMSFSIGDPTAPTLLPPMSFNVLYVETPRIGLLQTPEFQLLAQTWEETVELVKPLLRFGFPETSLRTKCPYYNENLYATSSGALLASDRQRRIMAGDEHGYLAGSHQHSHHNQHGHLQHSSSSTQHLHEQQQPDASSSSSSGPLGIGNLGFLNVTGLDTQHSPVRHTSLIPKSNLLVPELPSGTLVLGLNLLAYWAITKQSRRGFGG